MNGVGNIFLFNAALFGLLYVTGLARQFEDLWNILPECIGVWLTLGFVCKFIRFLQRSPSNVKPAERADGHQHKQDKSV
jgi:hypothetical protein